MTESSGAKDALPGTVVHVTPDECVVASGDGRLALREVMLEGRKRMPISEFLRGYRMPVGAVMGDVETGK
jgi:methionyl-tRNA formyltransferase